MTRHLRVIRPVVAGVLTLALAAGGVLLGLRLAAPATGTPAATAPALTAEAPFAPALAESDLPTSLSSAEDLAALDELAGADGPEVSVPLEVSDAALAAAAEEFTDGIIASDDPPRDGPTLLTESGLAPPADPCAASDAPAPGDCPAGASGLIRTGLRGGVPVLRITDSGAATGDAGHLGEYCPEFAELTLAVETTRPANITIQYTSLDGSFTASAFGRATEDIDEWVASAATHSLFDPDWPNVIACVELGALPAPGYYRADVVAYAPAYGVYDDETVTQTFQFHSGGVSTRPPSYIYASTDDVVTATVSHRSTDSVMSTVHVYPATGEVPTCFAAPTALDRTVRVLGAPREWEHSPADMDDRGWLPDFSSVTTTSWAVPEGLLLRVCATVRDAGGNAYYEATATVRTRDRLLPRISIWGINNPGASVDVWGTLQNGQACGFQTIGRRDARIAEPELPFCAFADLFGTAGAEVEPPAGRFIPLSAGVLGQYAISVLPQGARMADRLATRVIDLSSIGDCVGSCSLPPDRFYPIRWTTSDGRPAAVVVKVAWDQGNLNGATRTTVDALDDNATRSPDVPTLSTAAAVFTSSSTSFDGYQEVVLTASMIGATEGVARLVAAPGSGAICMGPDFTRDVVFSGGPTPAQLRFHGLCPGAEYQVQIVLTGPRGVSVWGADPSRGGAIPAGAVYAGDWGGSRYRVPAVDVRLITSVDLIDESPRTAAQTGLRLVTSIDGRALLGGAVVCMPTTSYSSDDVLIETQVGERIRISGTLQRLATCEGRSATVNAYPIPFVAYVSLAELRRRPAGIEIEISEYGYREVEAYGGQVHGVLHVRLDS